MAMLLHILVLMATSACMCWLQFFLPAAFDQLSTCKLHVLDPVANICYWWLHKHMSECLKVGYTIHMVVNEFRLLDICGYGFGNYSSDGALRHVTVWWWLAGSWWCALGFFAVSSSCFRSKLLLVLHLWSFCCNVLVYTTTTRTPLRMAWKKIVWQNNVLGVQCDGRHMCGHGPVGSQPFCQYQLGLRLALCRPWNGS